jgi:hypothetical protein
MTHERRVVKPKINILIIRIFFKSHETYIKINKWLTDRSKIKTSTYSESALNSVQNRGRYKSRSGLRNGTARTPLKMMSIKIYLRKIGF